MKAPRNDGASRQSWRAGGRDVLKKGSVFTDDMLDGTIELKMEEVARFEMTPRPIECDMYYSV